jgi:hypothetical protein
MTDTTNKTAVAKTLRSAADCIRDLGSGKGGWAWEEVADELDAIAAQPQAEPAEDDVRELRKWLNEEPNRPIDRAALARVLAAQPQAEVVPEGLQAVPVIAYLHHDSAFSWPGQRVDVSSAKRMVLLEDVEAALSARPPMAPLAPAAGREPGWNGPMVNDAAAQAEPVALLWQVMKALHLASAICDAVPSRDPGHLGKLVNAQDDGTHGYRVIHDAEKALAAYLTTPTVAQQGAAEAVAVAQERRDACSSLCGNGLCIAKGTGLPCAFPQPVAQGLTDALQQFVRHLESADWSRRHPQEVAAIAADGIRAALSTAHPADEGDSRG